MVSPVPTLSPSQLRRITSVGAAVLALVLILAGAEGWVAARALVGTLSGGQESLLETNILTSFPPERMPPDPDALVSLQHALEPEGLRWVGFVDHDGGVIAEAGARTLPYQTLMANPRMARLSSPGRVLGRAGMGHRRPPGPGGVARGERGGPPGDEGPGGADEPPGGLRAARLGLWFFEFAPIYAQVVQERALRTLALNVAVALVLLGGAAFLHRLSQRAEDLGERLHRERHLASLGELLAVLAHELRNPLASLKGNAQLLAEGLPEGPPRARAQWVVDESLRLEALTNSLLDFVRSGTVERVETDPRRILEEAAYEVGAGAIHVAVDGAPSSWSLDPLRVHQALSNLLRNALQAAPEPPPEARIYVEGDVLVFEVRDHGDGFPPEEAERLFEAFHTKRLRGTGLGLAVVRRVAELHHGRSQAALHPEGGAVFTLSIPAERP